MDVNMFETRPITRVTAKLLITPVPKMKRNAAVTDRRYRARE
jgi:hypothetical protein